jgi:MFS family permease
MNGRVIRWNMLVLAACFVPYAAVWQLVVSVSPLAAASLTGNPSFAGLALSVATLGGAIATVPGGRLMDAHGRRAGISTGFAIAALGMLIALVSLRAAAPILFFVGLFFFGAGSSIVALARVAAADMYAPERRARAVGVVLIGTAVGAVVGSLVFTPLLRGQLADAEGLALPWLIAAAFLMTSAAAIWLVRVDPLTIARAMRQNATATRAFDLRGVGIVLRRPDLRAAFTGAIAANVAMSASMPTMSLELHHRGHDLGDISVALGSHLVGMYVLAPFSGVLVDRIGRRASLIMGLGVLSLAVTGVLSAGLSVVVPAMFFVGAGWNIAYVASTALVADAAEPEERGLALGSMDLVATLASAAMSAAAPAILSGAGLGMVVSVAVAFAAVPAILLVLSRRRAPVAVGA